MTVVTLTIRLLGALDGRSCLMGQGFYFVK